MMFDPGKERGERKARARPQGIPGRTMSDSLRRAASQSRSQQRQGQGQGCGCILGKGQLSASCEWDTEGWQGSPSRYTMTACSGMEVSLRVAAPAPVVLWCPLLTKTFPRNLVEQSTSRLTHIVCSRASASGWPRLGHRRGGAAVEENEKPCCAPSPHHGSRGQQDRPAWRPRPQKTSTCFLGAGCSPFLLLSSCCQLFSPSPFQEASVPLLISGETFSSSCCGGIKLSPSQCPLQQQKRLRRGRPLSNKPKTDRQEKCTCPKHTATRTPPRAPSTRVGSHGLQCQVAARWGRLWHPVQTSQRPGPAQCQLMPLTSQAGLGVSRVGRWEAPPVSWYVCP